MLLHRPVGLNELRLIYQADLRAFPPRLPEQPIFYPVLNEPYAAKIARDWNTKSETLAGFVTRFSVDDAYGARFERRVVGSREHEELWVPAEELAEFNGHLEGPICPSAWPRRGLGSGMRALVSILTALTMASCGKPTLPARSRAAPFALEPRLGHVVTVEGIPEDAKLGALLMIGGSQAVWIDGLDAWPSELRGKVVEVTGKVIQRSDLPAFVHQDGEPERAGISVGAETDLEQARRRFLLAEARWRVVE